MTLTTVLTPQNQTAYDSLYVSLLDGLGTLQLLIAVCENDALRYEMIERYEQALKPEAQVWRVTLDPIEPSLRQVLYELTEQQTLTDYSAQIVTVLGAEKLDSEALKKFWGYLQWTREGLRAFPWPIVLWLPQRLLKEMMKKAPDFWRWRGGIFLFTLQTPSELSPTELMSSGEFSSSSSSLFSVEQLEDSLEKAIQQWGEDSPKLASLYGQLGKVYKQQIEQGHYTTVGQEASRAEQLLQKAINQSSQASDFLAGNLNNLALLYFAQGKYEEAETLFLRSLSIRESQLGENHPDVATSLNNLAELYRAQGKYAEAEPLYLRSLAILEKEFDFAKKQARNCGLDISKVEALLNAMEIDTHHSLSDKYKQMFYLAATGLYSADDLAKVFDYRDGRNVNPDFNRNLGNHLKSYLKLDDYDRVGITSLRRILFKKGYFVSL